MGRWVDGRMVGTKARRKKGRKEKKERIEGYLDGKKEEWTDDWMVGS